MENKLESKAHERDMQEIIDKYKDNEKKLFKGELKVHIKKLIDGYRRMRQSRNNMKRAFKMLRVHRNQLLLEIDALKGGDGTHAFDTDKMMAKCPYCKVTLISYLDQGVHAVVECPGCKKRFH